MRTTLQFILVATLGTCVLLLVSLTTGHTASQKGEYYYSDILRSGYNVMTGCLFFLIGVAIGYFTRLNPWLTGLGIILMFPIVAIYEAVTYKGSHNLIPFEMITFCIFALPAIMGVYIGRLIYNKRVVAAKTRTDGGSEKGER